MRAAGIFILIALLLGGGLGGYLVSRQSSPMPDPRPIAPRPPPPKAEPPRIHWPDPPAPIDPKDLVNSGPPDGMPKWNGKSLIRDFKDPQLRRLINKPYTQARKQMKALGYEPVIFRCRSDKDFCTSSTVHFRRRFLEILMCGNGMNGPCIFGWMHRGKGIYLEVGTNYEMLLLSGFSGVSWDHLAENQGRLISPRSHQPHLPSDMPGA